MSLHASLTLPCAQQSFENFARSSIFAEHPLHARTRAMKRERGTGESVISENRTTVALFCSQGDRRPSAFADRHTTQSSTNRSGRKHSPFYVPALAAVASVSSSPHAQIAIAFCTACAPRAKEREERRRRPAPACNSVLTSGGSLPLLRTRPLSENSGRLQV